MRETVKLAKLASYGEVPYRYGLTFWENITAHYSLLVNMYAGLRLARLASFAVSARMVTGDSMAAWKHQIN
jgi:hypothetical protein